MIEDVFYQMMNINQEFYVNYNPYSIRKPKWVSHLFTLFLVVLFFGLNHIIIKILELDSLTTLETFFEGPNFFQKINWDYSLLLMLSIVFFFTEIDFVNYKNQILQYTSIYKGFHRLSKEDVFNNENRQEIIKIILNNPGIHYNLILKRSNLQSGQLQWHLNILSQYGVIKKEKFGRYLVFYPAIYDETIKKNENIFIKSPTTMKIYNIIKEEPGICSSTIAKMLKLQRNSVKYHIDKLLTENYISSVQKGRKNHLYKNEL
jgi:predicted transcriptional regulator